jgi:hypothetical protein
VYWYGPWGIHQVVFAGMLRNIVITAGKAYREAAKGG